MYNDNNKIKALIVDDSAFMRRVISDMLKADPRIEVVDTANNGKEGIEKANRTNPDIITLDIEMPVMNGLDALPELMKIKPTPKIIMLSSLTHEGAEETIKALELGAMDFIQKPSDSIFKISRIKDDLIAKVINLSRTKAVAYPTIKTNMPIQTQKKEIEKDKGKDINHKDMTAAGKLKYIIVIGTSTGGPRALQDVIPPLPADIPAAVLVVQHMPPGFTKSLSTRLDSISNLHVKEAEDGDLLKPGWAYIAPGDYHMILQKFGIEDYKISINKNPPVGGHRPSVNVMMNSVVESGHKNLIAVIMTGMGSDGSEGILKIKKLGGKTIAQNEETCIVYGMPKAAVNLGAIDRIVPLQEITNEILKFMGV